MLKSPDVNPVMLTFGRAKLVARPNPTGSPTCTKTVGDRRSVLAERHGGQRSDSEQRIGMQVDQFLGNGSYARDLASTEAIVDAQTGAFGPA